MNLAEDIVRNVDIVDYIQRFLPLRKSGANRVGSCPFHKEKSPSFMVSDSKWIFKCFGCGKGWDVITFAMEYERMDFVDTLKYLAEYAHLPLENYPKVHNDPIAKQTREQTKSLNLTVSNHFQSNLQNNQKALDYLHKRNLDDQIINHFQLGYAAEWYYDLINYLKNYGFSSEQMLESGVCKAGTSGDIYDFFRNRIMFPIWDQIGNIIAFTWRVLDPNDNPKYLNITNTSLYDKSKVLYGINFVKKHISEHNKIIVVEWNMDVIALHRLWLPIAVATCWTSLSHEHIKLLKRHTDHVYFSFDNDDAGFSATVRWLKLAFEQDLYPQVLQISQLQQYGKCKDIDDLANAWWTAQDLLSTAVDALEFVIQQLWIKYNLSNPVDKKKCVDTVFEIIKSINDLSITQHYISLSSKLLDISEETLLWQYKSRYKKIRFSTNKPQEEKMNIDHNSLIDALFQEELQTHYQWSEKIQYILSYYERLLVISKIEKSNTEESKGYILWRDKELDGLDNEKKEQFIYSVIIKRIDELLKSIVKLSSIGTIEKTELMEMRRKLR